MSKCHEIPLNEIRIHSNFLNDTLSAILQTILFVRAPNIVKAKDQVCETLHPLTFAKCGSADVDQTISETIEIFKKSLYQIGPGRHFRGEMVLSFYDVKEIKEYLGFVTRNENFYFERWRICIVLLDVVNSTASNIPQRRHSTGSQRDNVAVGSDGTYTYGSITDLNEMDANTCYYTAYDQVSKAMTAIIEAVNASSDHIPLTLYDYEVQVITPPSGNTAGASNKPGMVSKLINSPGMFNAMG